MWEMERRRVDKRRADAHLENLGREAGLYLANRRNADKPRRFIRLRGRVSVPNARQRRGVGHAADMCARAPPHTSATGSLAQIPTSIYALAPLAKPNPSPVLLHLWLALVVCN